jgi:SNF2 family DNA or RNA helicase
MEADYRWSVRASRRLKSLRVSCSRPIVSFRLQLTGTPITNGVEDLFGQFRFLRTPKFHDWEEFKCISLAFKWTAGSTTRS